MRFSTSIEYAIHSLVYLANNQGQNPVLVSEAARATRVPETYLRKVFQQLARRGVLVSQRGANGGFRLARDPSQITLKDLVEAVDGSLPTYSCLKTTRGCSLATPCPVHDVFEEARVKMAEVLDRTSVQDLLGLIRREQPVAPWLDVKACWLGEQETDRGAGRPPGVADGAHPPSGGQPGGRDHPGRMG